jgi:regulator of protease activity HflC (stomatin/prohibitin superfamily)
MDVPAQDVITKDNVSIKVNAVLYFRVLDPNRAVTEVENYLFATSQNAQTTLRSVCGEVELDDLLAEREKINTQLQTIIDQHTEPWGIKVVQVAIKHIDLPDEMRRAMARQAEAERERRAKVIAAEGEFQAAQRLGEAARSWPASRSRSSFATCRRSGDRHREQPDDDLPRRWTAPSAAGAPRRTTRRREDR